MNNAVQDLFDELHALVDHGPRELVPMQNSVRKALGLPPRFGFRCGTCGQDFDEGSTHAPMECGGGK
jgi:hypothetical protein